jgi:hypothetical protein
VPRRRHGVPPSCCQGGACAKRHVVSPASGARLDAAREFVSAALASLEQAIQRTAAAKNGPAATDAPGVIDSYCDNQIGGNIDNGTVPNDLCPKLLPTPPAIVTETVTQTVPAPQQCVVPALRGLQVAFARRL